MALYVDRDEDKQALTIAGPLLKELKKIDDKALLVEVWINFDMIIVCRVYVML